MQNSGRSKRQPTLFLYSFSLRQLIQKDHAQPISLLFMLCQDKFHNTKIGGNSYFLVVFSLDMTRQEIIRHKPWRYFMKHRHKLFRYNRYDCNF